MEKDMGMSGSEASMGASVRDAVAVLGDWYPLSLAESWDNVGLLLGGLDEPLSGIQTCLTLTSEVAEEAIEVGASLIVTHHPIFFRGLKQFTTNGPNGFLYHLTRAGVSVYSPHTAFDGAEQGINEQWARRIGLTHLKPLRPAPSADMCKLTIFTPTEDLDAVQKALFENGAGRIGAYNECSFRSEGLGSFRGDESSNPTIGQPGQREEVCEWRLEVMVPASLASTAAAAAKQAHSYEEAVVDIVPMTSALDASVGAGRFGELPFPLSLDLMGDAVGRACGADHVEMIDRSIDASPCQRAAVACGAGDDLLDDAIRQGCDVFITGEARFHTLLKAKQANLRVVLAGHYSSERFAVESLAERLALQFRGVDVWASKREKNPCRNWTVRRVDLETAQQFP